ncbi:MAG: NADPH-dependent glutamate synthase [Candidatus Lokiarchaeota archaeon]|nr:NADPH-dependent glutamate synthase [Candidatus Lokiarchaeota archaeon]
MNKGGKPKITPNNGKKNNGKKTKKKISRHKMPEQDPSVRIRNFNEVNLGYSPETAVAEANRCLQCPRPKCIEGCPVNVDIPGFIKYIQEGDFCEAEHHIKKFNALPAICGRVCPQEDQCEGNCVLGKKYKPLAIGNLERFVADYERNSGSCYLPEKEPPKNKKIACIGCGPASLTVAGDLIKLGYEVTIYEAFHKGGGVLSYGIPEFRLPKDIVDAEIDYLVAQGVEVKYNMVIGKVLTINDLWEMDYDAIFIGIGAGTPRFLGVPGENLKGIVAANEYLTRVNLMKAYDFPKYKTPVIKGKNITVIGGGNVAMDSARTALRLGAKSVKIVYRRAMEQLPARKEEVHHAIEEGVIFKLLTNPKRFIGDRKGRVKKIEVIKMKLGAPDKSGRARPISIPKSEFTISTDLVIIAIGNNANPLLTSTCPNLELNKWGNIKVDENGKTSIDGIYAGGDIVTGSATVISAMGAGRKAAKSINEYLLE